MTIYKIGLLDGDGIGQEIIPSVIDVLNTIEHQSKDLHFDIRKLPMGWQAIKKYETPLPEITKQGLKAVDGWIMGPHDSVSYPDEYKKIKIRVVNCALFLICSLISDLIKLLMEQVISYLMQT